MDLATNLSGPVLASLMLASAALAARLVGWLPSRHEHRWLYWMQALAVGLLLGDASMHMLPEAAAHGVPARAIGECLALGIAALLLIESIVRFSRTATSPSALARMNIVGDTVHHFVDGVVIGAIFSISPSLGMVVTAAIIGHELPREASNAAILVAAGYRPSQAFGLSMLTTIAIPFGAAGIFMLGQASSWMGISLALAAGTTLYLALGDILPSLWPRLTPSNRFVPFLGVAAGLVFMWFAARWE